MPAEFLFAFFVAIPEEKVTLFKELAALHIEDFKSVCFSLRVSQQMCAKSRETLFTLQSMRATTLSWCSSVNSYNTQREKA
jgi:hypothetical protein